MVGMELLLSCGAMVHIETMHALVKTESSYNPYAIAVVNDKPIKQPKTLEEAEQAIDWLEANHKNYSVGLGQVNKSNFKKYNTNGKALLNACHNIKVSEKILAQCFMDSPNKSVAEALSCYYAGNFSYGFVKESVGKKGERSAYVERVINNFQDKEKIVVPSIKNEIPQALAKVREPKQKPKTTYSKCEDPNLIWNAEDYKETCILGKTGGQERIQIDPISQKSLTTKTAKKPVELKAVKAKPQTTKLVKNPPVLDSDTAQSETNGTAFKF